MSACILLQVRSLQMFRAPVQSAATGDRAAMAVTQLDAEAVERGLAAAPGSVPTFVAAVAAVEKIRFFLGAILSSLLVTCACSPTPARSPAPQSAVAAIAAVDVENNPPGCGVGR